MDIDIIKFVESIDSASPREIAHAIDVCKTASNNFAVSASKRALFARLVNFLRTIK